MTTGLERDKSLIEIIRLMLYREIIAVCSEIYRKDIKTVWAERIIAEC